jgi:hypothetical protein
VGFRLKTNHQVVPYFDPYFESMQLLVAFDYKPDVYGLNPVQQILGHGLRRHQLPLPLPLDIDIDIDIEIDPFTDIQMGKSVISSTIFCTKPFSSYSLLIHRKDFLYEKSYPSIRYFVNT